MAESETTASESPEIHRKYVLGVRILRLPGDRPRYRFEASDHQQVEFEDPEAAELYADVYFDVNGFVESGTGDRGIPPAVVQAGKDTIAAYLLTHPDLDVDWVASFFGRKPGQIEAYRSWVRERAEEIRTEAARRDLDA